MAIEENDVEVGVEFGEAPSGDEIAGARSSEDDSGEGTAGSRYTEERERSRKLQNDSTDENLTRKRWGRWAGLAFMLVFSLVTIGMIAAITCLVYKLIVAFSIRELVPTPFPDTNVWAHVLPILPIFSLSLIALLMFVTLSRFATDFINEERRDNGKATNDDSDEAAAIRVIKRLLALCGGGKS